MFFSFWVVDAAADHDAQTPACHRVDQPTDSNPGPLQAI